MGFVVTLDREPVDSQTGMNLSVGFIQVGWTEKPGPDFRRCGTPHATRAQSTLR